MIKNLQFHISGLIFIAVIVLAYSCKFFKKEHSDQKNSGALQESQIEEKKRDGQPWQVGITQLIKAPVLKDNFEQDTINADLKNLDDRIFSFLSQTEPTLVRMLRQEYLENQKILIRYEPEMERISSDLFDIKVTPDVITLSASYFKIEDQSERIALLVGSLVEGFLDRHVSSYDKSARFYSDLKRASLKLAKTVLGTDVACDLCRMRDFSLSTVLDNIFAIAGRNPLKDLYKDADVASFFTDDSTRITIRLSALLKNKTKQSLKLTFPKVALESHLTEAQLRLMAIPRFSDLYLLKKWLNEGVFEDDQLIELKPSQQQIRLLLGFLEPILPFKVITYLWPKRFELSGQELVISDIPEEIMRQIKI